MTAHLTVTLPTPNLDDDNIIGYEAGLRPYRSFGIRIAAEYIKKKLIIHNYGYGGSGLTLCFGGAHQVIAILQEKNNEISNQSIAILGAGVIGLALAHELLNLGARITIYADQFSPHLTSNMALGILSAPLLNNEPAQYKKMIEKMEKISYQYFLNNLDQPKIAGVKMIMDYCFAENMQGRFKSFSIEKKPVTVHFTNGLIKTGMQIREIGLDGKLFMNDLAANVTAKGAKIIARHFMRQQAVLALPEPIIINCTSLGSQQLFGDDNFTPVKGHHIYFKPQQGIDFSCYDHVPNEENYWIKLYPWRDKLILGGVFEKKFKDSAPDKKVINKLLRFARERFRV